MNTSQFRETLNVPENIQKDWNRLIKTMDIPELRRTITEANLMWFLRNAQIKNANHPNILMALDKARFLLK
jgi:hypothetical protein